MKLFYNYITVGRIRKCAEGTNGRIKPTDGVNGDF